MFNFRDDNGRDTQESKPIAPETSSMEQRLSRLPKSRKVSCQVCLESINCTSQILEGHDRMIIASIRDISRHPDIFRNFLVVEYSCRLEAVGSPLNDGAP